MTLPTGTYGLIGSGETNYTLSLRRLALANYHPLSEPVAVRNGKEVTFQYIGPHAHPLYPAQMRIGVYSTKGANPTASYSVKLTTYHLTEDGEGKITAKKREIVIADKMEGEDLLDGMTLEGFAQPIENAISVLLPNHSGTWNTTAYSESDCPIPTMARLGIIHLPGVAS